MDDGVSPAAERAANRAAELAAGPVGLVHWVLALLEDEDGHPAALLARVGGNRNSLWGELPTRVGAGEFAAPTDLFLKARNLSLKLRHDPAVTSDVLFAAVVGHDSEFADLLRPFGVEAAALEMALRRVADVAETPGAVFAVPADETPREAGRIVDANLNRAREALRVLDDYARFVRNDAGLTERLKRLRHRVAAAAELLPAGLLIESRDTLGDVGTGVTAAGEYDRVSPAQVAAVNVKRLQESLRSCEEFGKLLNADFARECEAIRYSAYTMERELTVDRPLIERLNSAKLYVLLSGATCPAALDWTIAEAAVGGAEIVQLREKGLPDADLLQRAKDVRRWTRQAGVLFVVNDRPDIALLSEADGLHLGQDDLPVAAARRIVGTSLLIGVSTHSVEQIHQAVADGADYLGVGPTFPSRTKSFEHFPGLEFVAATAVETAVPFFVLGGVDAANIGDVVRAGGTRVAVSAAVAAADDPRAAAAAIRYQLLG